jgi:hypothetical protein
LSHCSQLKELPTSIGLHSKHWICLIVAAKGIAHIY